MMNMSQSSVSEYRREARELNDFNALAFAPLGASVAYNCELGMQEHRSVSGTCRLRETHGHEVERRPSRFATGFPASVQASPRSSCTRERRQELTAVRSCLPSRDRLGPARVPTA